MTSTIHLAILQVYSKQTPHFCCRFSPSWRFASFCCHRHSRFRAVVNKEFSMVVTPSFTWRQFYNPYAGRQAAVVPGAGLALTTTRPVVNDDNNNKNMGIQSQNREGAIKACKKRATQRKGKARPKYRQSAVPGGTIFINWQHCKVCKAEQLIVLRGKKISIPHRPHHVRCSRNRTTRGASATTVTSERDSLVDQQGCFKIQPWGDN